MRGAALLAGMLCCLGAVAADYVPLPGAVFNSVLPADGQSAPASIAPFAMRVEPVTNAEYLAFVQVHPEWRKGSAPTVLADGAYLSHWEGASTLGPKAGPGQPVTQVSWFAARAYCESEQARLPTWYEWEYAAAADAHRADARADPAWRERVLAWYGRPSTVSLASVGGEANVYGVRDLHGLVWEWVDDFNALLVSADSRDQNSADTMKFCGAGALTMQQKENYATLMRVAMLSALKASDTTRNMGFRCVRPR
ncbi:formylglycine-generating enzyme family protein [Dyella japonica]|uniref:Signal peptide protein n=1 Tax=Dyella japonica A8 TaxID=1217721 RepID=A0A075K5L3_9GAMM|nr:formylglycine-generating enzyme family protein [Dyella japonica]AIF49415.1 signal peptide protein [Dyella japonica A8]